MFEWMNENNKKKVINKLCVCKLIANNIISFFYLSGTEIDCMSRVEYVYNIKTHFNVILNIFCSKMYTNAQCINDSARLSCDYHSEHNLIVCKSSTKWKTIIRSSLQRNCSKLWFLEWLHQTHLSSLTHAQASHQWKCISIISEVSNCNLRVYHFHCTHSDDDKQITITSARKVKQYFISNYKMFFFYTICTFLPVPVMHTLTLCHYILYVLNISMRSVN